MLSEINIKYTTAAAAPNHGQCKKFMLKNMSRAAMIAVNNLRLGILIYFDDIITKNFKKSNKSPIFTTKNYPQFLHLQRLARHGATG